MTGRMALGAGLLWLCAFACTTLPDLPEPQEVVDLEQGWNDPEERQDFYYRSQGGQIIPYDWFLALEQSVVGGGDLGEPFRSNGYLARMGFIPNPSHPRYNPNGLPIGFARDDDPETGAWIGLTCAACHTTEISYGGTALRIEGGAGMPDLTTFAEALIKALTATLLPTRFERFAKKVLKDQYDDPAARQQLKDALKQTIERLGKKALIIKVKRLEPNPPGFGRLDALGRGGNTVFSALDEKNLVVANAPVSMGHLWDAPFFDWTQWNGSISQPMTRNIAEALGVGAKAKFTADPKQRYQSTVRVRNLYWMEEMLKKLKAPPWPEHILGPIDRVKASQGEALYQQLCSKCHDPRWNAERGLFELRMLKVEFMGSDPTYVTNFFTRRANTGPLGLGVLPAARALELITGAIKERRYQEEKVSEEERAQMDCCAETRFRAPLELRARPLNGIWATPPYFHNGSVPNLYQVLVPAEERDKTFYVGNREFDPSYVGFRTEPFEGGFKFDTSIPGNLNTGHEFKDGPQGKGIVGRRLTEDERWALVEYLKTLRDVPRR